MIFNARNCTGCGDCRQICPEQAISLLEMDDPIEFTEKMVYRDEMVSCSKCNTAYASAKMIRKVAAALQINERIPMCPTCRGMGMYDALFSKTWPKVADRRTLRAEATGLSQDAS